MSARNTARTIGGRRPAWSKSAMAMSGAAVWVTAAAGTEGDGDGVGVYGVVEAPGSKLNMPVGNVRPDGRSP